MLLLTLRGTPTIYYGDELGMENVAIPPEQEQDPFGLRVPGLGLGRDPERTPMQWDASANAGFAPGGVTLAAAGARLRAAQCRGRDGRSEIDPEPDPRTAGAAQIASGPGRSAITPQSTDCPRNALSTRAARPASDC